MKKCSVCNKQFKIRRFTYRTVTCGKKCANALRSISMLGKNKGKKYYKVQPELTGLR